ncbi:MAG: HYR domain-containing protein, partial [Verrucomicrobia bacterium]|nr:HYR domain-containing protein [Verrucomicrobiota bacterium]
MGPGYNNPLGMAFYPDSTLYVARAGNSVERFDTNGIGSIFASTMINGPWGLAVNPPPTISCPTDITANSDPGQCFAVVSYPEPSVLGNAVKVSCDPPSGSSFPVGVTRVTCMATDAEALTTTCSFNVVVNDTGLLVPCLGVGGTLWNDLNGDSIRQAGEPGISNVWVQVFRDDGDGIFQPYISDSLAGNVSTDANGRYLITSLAPGQYWVELNNNDFNSLNALYGLVSSPGVGAADNDLVNDDSGQDDPFPQLNGIHSTLVTLSVGGEPDVAVDGDGPNINSTVDFGFIGFVNHAPSFTKGADQTVAQNAGAQTINGWATAISPGPPNESTEILNFIVSNNFNALFSAPPAIAANGTLTFTPATNL